MSDFDIKRYVMKSKQVGEDLKFFRYCLGSYVFGIQITLGYLNLLSDREAVAFLYINAIGSAILYWFTRKSKFNALHKEEQVLYIGLTEEAKREKFMRLMRESDRSK